MDEELETINIERIRDICSEQCKSRWTAMASRARLYQFMAMSDEKTQVAMQQKLLMIAGKVNVGSVRSVLNGGNGSGGFVASDTSFRPRENKR